MRNFKRENLASIYAPKVKNKLESHFTTKAKRYIVTAALVALPTLLWTYVDISLIHVLIYYRDSPHVVSSKISRCLGGDVYRGAMYRDTSPRRYIGTPRTIYHISILWFLLYVFSLASVFFLLIV